MYDWLVDVLSLPAEYNDVLVYGVIAFALISFGFICKMIYKAVYR